MVPTVFFVNESVTGVESLSREEILAIFSRELRNWKSLGGPDDKIYLVSREKGDSSIRVLSQHIAGFNDLETPSETVFFGTPEAMDAIARHPFTIGYGPLSMQPAGSKVLAFEGVYPKAENIRSGEYPMVTPLLLAWKEPLPAAYRSFVDFLFTPVAAKIMRAEGVWPSGRQPE
jgi:phosphate transport system substrate-binding protein